MSTIAEVSSAINIRADIVAQNGVVVAARIGDMNAELCVAEDDVACGTRRAADRVPGS